MEHKKKQDRKLKLASRLTLEKVLAEKQWHSSVGFDIVDSSKQHTKIAIDNNTENMNLFESAGYLGNVKVASSGEKGIPGELLIHKSTHALWHVSDDGKSIEPAFSDDIITIGDGENE